MNENNKKVIYLISLGFLLFVALFSIFMLKEKDNVKLKHNLVQEVGVDVILDDEINKADSNIPKTKIIATSSDGNLVVSAQENRDKEWSKSVYYKDLWTLNILTGETELLVVGGPFKQPIGHPEVMDYIPDEIPNIYGATFSSDDKTLYFITDYYVVSDAIFAVDLNNKQVRFITGGNYVDVIRQGKYKDYLITNQHRYYHDQDGSYDYYYITDPSNGKDVEVLGDDLSSEHLKLLSKQNEI